MELIGERIYLRKMTLEDTDDIIRWRNAKHVMERFLFREPLTRDMHLQWIAKKVETGLVEQFVICEKESRKGVGSFYFRDIDKVNRTAELGIFLGEESALGKGYGTEAVRLGMEYAFNVMNLKKVILRVLSENQTAIHSYEKNGFCVIPERMEKMVLDGKEETVIFMESNRT